MKVSRGLRPLPWPLISLFALATASFASALPQSSQSLSPQNTSAIILRAVQNEVNPEFRKPLFRYTIVKAGDRVTFTKDVIETPDGDVSRVIAIDGKPPDAEKQSLEAARLQDLSDSVATQQRRLKRDRDDRAHADRMICEMPQAFQFTLVDVAPGPYGPSWHFSFQPNPAFVPPDRESEMLRSMAGEVWIDQKQQHMVKLQARLTGDIDFGWGMLARFYKGGTVSMVNSNVGGTRWQITHLQFHVDGKALMLKALSFHITENLSDFQPVAQNLAIPAAVHLLQQPAPPGPGTASSAAPSQ